jgi:hypothetical protein
VAGRDVDDNAIWMPSTFAYDGFQIRAVWIQREHPATAQIQNEQTARSYIRRWPVNGSLHGDLLFDALENTRLRLSQWHCHQSTTATVLMLNARPKVE